MRIPIEGVVEWQLPNGHLPYSKLKIIGIEYEFARQHSGKGRLCKPGKGEEGNVSIQ